jgi:hypothetical protein
MPTTEPSFGWPLPEDTDPLKDGAAAIRALAAGIAGDVVAGSGLKVQIGQGSITTATDDDRADGEVVFPEAFGGTPIAVVGFSTSTSWICYASTNHTATSVRFWIGHRQLQNGSGGDVTVNYIAVGPA